MAIDWDVIKKKAKKKEAEIYKQSTPLDIAPFRSDIAPVKTTVTDDIAPVRKTNISAPKKSLFDDGYDFGDITRTILGSREAKAQETSAFDDALNKKYSAMSFEQIENEYARIEAEEKAFKDANGGKFINYLAKAGSYLAEGKSGRSGSATRNKSQSNIDKINDLAREKEIINIYRKQRATEHHLGGLSAEQLKLLDNISESNALDDIAPVIAATGGDSAVFYNTTSKERNIGKSAREKLFGQLKEKNPKKSDDELNEIIDNMVELRRNQVNAEEQAKRDEEMKKTASDSAVGSFILSRGSNILGGVTGLSELYLQRDNEYGYDTNAAGFMLTKDSNTIDEQIQLDHDWTVEVGGTEVDAFDLVYSAGTGIIDNLGRLAMSGGNSKVAAAMMFAQSTTQSIIDGKEKGYSDAKALTMGLLSGTFEAISEKLSLDIILDKKGSSVLKKLAKSFVAEGGEELTSNWLNRIADEVANGNHSELTKKYNNYISKGYTKAQALAEVVCSVVGEDFETFLIGGISGGVMGGSVEVARAASNNHLTETERKVFDKIVEDRIAEKTKDGNKLTTRDKIKIREAVKTDMEKGRIDIDTLERILGGEAYNNYKSVTEQEEALQKEFNTLNKMKQSDMTGEQVDRRAELKQQLEELKSNSKKTELKDKLSKDVFALAKDSRLVESYNEKARRGKAFEADLSKYDAAQQETIKKAVDSGILNNTNRTHEFVDMLAKISADKGVLFDFTSNEKLKNSSFALEGKTVNGYVTGDSNVAVNVDSSKSLNTVVGHEITHILEGTELYDALHQSIVAYAKAKGDYDGRYKSIEKLYEGIEGADINKELTADLVGDYLFTDENFIRNLSTEQPGVFKKVYDEIKYLCKVATAGSKEARELEKIKKTFSDIYRDSGKAQKNTTEEGGVRYMISKDVDGNTFVDVTEDIFDVNNGESVARTIQRVISERFNNLIEVNGQKIQINKTTNDEFRRSNSAMHFLKNPSQVYNDKLKTIANADEILSAAKGWIGEERAHDRKDDIVEFARANVMFRVGENGYVADVLVGIRENGAAVLYDLVNIYDKKITEASVTMASEEIDSQRRQNASVTDIIPQNSEKSSDNTSHSLSSEDAEPVKHGDYHVTGDDVRFAPVRKDIAEKSQNKAQKAQKLSNEPPIREDIAKNATTTPKSMYVTPIEEINVPSGDDITDEAVSITTVKERLEANLQNATTELENNKKHREESIERINTKIANYQAMYESKKNKDTQVANNLLRSIERLKNNRDNITAQYDKRINDIEKRIDKINGQLQQDHTKEDKLERALKRIDTRLEREKQELIDAYNLKKGKIEETTADKDAFVSKKAYELYRELWNLKKGVRASQELSAMLDYKPDWGELKRSLLHIKASPSQRVDEDSSIESIAREIITTAYEDELYSVDESYADLKKQLDELDADAEKDRQRAREFSARKKKQEQYEQEVSDLIGDTSTWRDKPFGKQYQINTLHRNLRDVVRKEDGSRDIEKADRIYEYLQGSYNRNEAELKRESKKIKKAFLDMKINKYESEYIQMVGELRYYPGTTLTRDVTDAFYEQHKKKIDVDKVEKAITESRKVYDDLIQRVNAVLKEQGMKEIPYIKGYYPHFTKDKQGLLGKLLNWKTVNNDIPTDIAGLTEMFTPVRTHQSFNKHREGRETDYDFAQGFDTYVHGALDWIYHIEDIQKRRAFENVIRYTHSEDGLKKKVDEIKNNAGLDADEAQELINKAYENSKNPLGNFVIDLRNSTNNLAGKKSTRDRNMEYDTNRHVYSTMTNISNRVSANAIAGSISSALTNFIPITQSWGQVNPVYSLAAAKDAVRNALKDDGMVNKSTFMTNRLLEEENLKKTGWDVAGEKLSLLMNVADHFTTEVVWRSKYLQNLQNGMSENEAIDNADIFAENVMAGRSRGNMPTIFNAKNPVAKTFTAFQLEVANQYGYMFKDMPQDIGEKNIKKLVSGYTKMFVGAYVYNVIFSALTGRDAAFDPIGIIVDLCKDLGLGSDDEEDEEPDVFGAVRKLGENVAQEIPFVGGLLGGGRIPISNALPYELKAGEFLDDLEGRMTSETPETYRKRFIKEFSKPLYYLVMPMGGGQLKKSVEGLKMFDDDLPISGSYTDSGKLRFPVEDTLGNKVQAAVFGQYASENAREYFDEAHAPLTEKQTQEFIDIDVPIADYWKYREGLKGLETTEDKFDYVNSLNLPVSKKNILINNLVDRKEPVNLENYSDFSSLEEFDYSVKNPGKYAVSKVTGGYESYKVYSKALSNIEGNTDNFGKTISGSRKINVANYISGLDADYYTKIILFKSEYNSDHRYDYEIVTHLNSRNDLTYEEKVDILTELGFTVGPNGNIGWE